MPVPPRVKETERDIFRDSMNDVDRHTHNRVKPYRPRPNPAPSQSKRDDRDVVDSLLSDYPSIDEMETGEELMFARPGLQRNVLRRLRRGDYIVEAELDLHGLTSEAARTDLNAFVRKARENGRRCVRIIHGKGLRSPDKRSVLKAKTDRWLRQKDEVLAFCSARPVDGGTGAVYVLLKR